MKKERLKPNNFFEDRKYFNIAEAIYYENSTLLKDYLTSYKDLDINKLGKRGANLLMYSIIIEKRKMMKILLEHGADPNVKSEIVPYTDTINEKSVRLCTYPLGEVVEYYEDYNKKYIELLVKYGADINDNTCYQPPFIHAVHSSARRFEKKRELMSVLLKNGANINVQNKYGETPLISSFGGSFPFETLEWLLDNGADYKITDNYNVSIVHWLQDFLEENADTGDKFLEHPRQLKKRLENKGVIFPKGSFFPVKEGERLPDIEYKK